MLKLFIDFCSICYALKSNFVLHFNYPVKSYNMYVIIRVNICGHSVFSIDITRAMVLVQIEVQFSALCFLQVRITYDAIYDAKVVFQTSSNVRRKVP
jgi:hypothetical protein